MSCILVIYKFQNDIDKAENSYFVDPNPDNAQILKDILDLFPPQQNSHHTNKGYHFRFHDQIAKNVNCWVDIRNLNAKIPIINKTVKMKVLITPEIDSSKIFKRYMESVRNPKNFRSSIMSMQSNQEIPKIHRRNSGGSMGELDFTANVQKPGPAPQNKHLLNIKKEEDRPRPKSQHKIDKPQDNCNQQTPSKMANQLSPVRENSNKHQENEPVGLEAMIMAENINCPGIQPQGHPQMGAPNTYGLCDENNSPKVPDIQNYGGGFNKKFATNNTSNFNPSGSQNNIQGQVNPNITRGISSPSPAQFATGNFFLFLKKFSTNQYRNFGWQ